MTFVEQAIRDAVEKGGWIPAGIQRWNKNKLEASDAMRFMYPTGEALRQSGHLSEWFLDPAFWQALGKARGWSDTYHADWKGDYKYHWHRFIDHLAEGKDAESFFKDL